MATMAKAISLAPLQGRLEGMQTVFDVAVNVFQHHDGIVHHQTDGQHQSQQGQGVDGEPKA